MFDSPNPHHRGAVLHSGETLLPDDFLRSANGRYQLRLQAHDGNLVLYRQQHDRNEHPTWSSKTQKPAGDADMAQRLTMQADGNLVLYRAGDGPANARWATGTNKEENKDTYAELQNDGNLVLYRPGQHPVWSSKTHSHAHWMQDLPDHLKLTDVCMPGSHDGGMYYTSINVGEHLAITQSLTLYEQLRQGSRYFDLRPNYVEHYVGTNDFYVHHGIADGHRISVLLQDLARFFNEGSSETVIVEFSHWKNFADKNQDGAFVELLLKYLPEHCLLKTPADTGVVNMTLGDLRGKLLLVLDNTTMFRNEVLGKCHQGFLVKASNDNIGLSACHKLALYDSYANKQSLESMLADQEQKFATFSDDGKLFMLNWTLTPLSPDAYKEYLQKNNPLNKLTPGFIDSLVGNIASLDSSGSVKNFAQDINPRLAHELRKDQPLAKRNKRGKLVNIINCDFVELAQAVPLCRAITMNNLRVPIVATA